MKNRQSIIYYGNFENGQLQEGYDKRILSDGYKYEGKFHGLGNLAIQISDLTDIDQSNMISIY